MPEIKYVKGMQDRLKFTFDGLDIISENYSNIYQDMFVLTVLNGRQNGSYLEIGAAEPEWLSNTKILERDFNWKGISVELDGGKVSRFNSARKNKCICASALDVDYYQLVKDAGLGDVIDYLSVDIEPPRNTFDALKKIPHDKLKFRIITFEHDFYTGQGAEVRQESREFLKSLGYELFVADVSIDDRSAEDWYVHPELLDRQNIDMLKCIPNTFINYNEYFYK